MQIYYSHCNCNTIPSTIIRGSVSSFCIQHMPSLLYQIKDPSLFIHICILFHSQLESICDSVIMGLLYMWLDRIYPSKSIKKEDVRKTWVCIILKAKFCTFLYKQQTPLLICLQILFQLFLRWRRWEEPKNPNYWVFSKKHKKLIMLGISHTWAPSMNQSCALADLRTNVCDPAILQYCNSIPQWIDCLFSPKSMFSIIECSILMWVFCNYTLGIMTHFEVKDMNKIFHLKAKHDTCKHELMTSVSWAANTMLETWENNGGEAFKPARCLINQSFCSNIIVTIQYTMWYVVSWHGR